MRIFEEKQAAAFFEAERYLVADKLLPSPPANWPTDGKMQINPRPVVFSDPVDIDVELRGRRWTGTVWVRLYESGKRITVYYKLRTHLGWGLSRGYGTFLRQAVADIVRRHLGDSRKDVMINWEWL